MESEDIKEKCSIEDLPEEVLEYILSLIPPYKDLQACMLVSRRWNRCALNVVTTKQRNFQKAISTFDVRWHRVHAEEVGPTITKRYSHTAVICDDSMFVFGGCTSTMTTFNDLWRLDLCTRTWNRPLSMGTYPSPKACSSLVHYKEFLVLFGGWTSPPSYPLHQSRHLFNELHVYNILLNRWTCIHTVSSPPPVAGHSASVIGEWMIVFGGLQKPNTAVHCEKSNEIWKLHLETWTWYKQEVKGQEPSGRFGQTQVVIDDTHILILGGCGGPNSQYSDCWLLNMEGAVWTWIKVNIEGKPNEANNIWSNPGCKVGDKILVLNKIKYKEESMVVYYPRSQWNQRLPEDGRLSRIDLANRKLDLDENVNGRRGILKTPKRDEEEQFEPVAGPSGNPQITAALRIFELRLNNLPAITQSSQFRVSQRSINREKRLERLQNLEEKFIRSQKARQNQTPVKKEKKGHYLGLYVLDISRVLDKHPVAEWLPPKNVSNGPEEVILYSLVKGRSELVMFGGILKDPNTLAPCNLNNQISNALHFITAPNYVI